MQFSRPTALGIQLTLPLRAGNRGLEHTEVATSGLGLRLETVLPAAYGRATAPVVPPSLCAVFEDNPWRGDDSDELEQSPIPSEASEHSL